MTDVAHWLRLDWMLVAVVGGWLVIGLAGVLALRRFTFVSRVLFPAGGALGLLLFGLALAAVFNGAEVAVLPVGLPNLPFHLRLDSLAAFFLMVIGAVSAGISTFAAGYFRKAEGTPPGLMCLEYHVFLASMVAGGAGRRRLRLHGDVGNHGAVVVFPRDGESPRRRSSPRRLSVPDDGAHRGHRHPALLWRAAGQHRRLHLRQHARAAPFAVLGLDRLSAGPAGVRRQGRPGAAACLAARGASGSAVAGVRADERRDAQDGDLRHAARFVRPVAHAVLVVGRAAAGAGTGHGAVWGGVRRGAGRHEAPAGLLLDREHRPAVRQHRPDPDLLRVRHESAGGAGPDGHPLPRRQPCVLQEPAVPVHRLRAARDRRAQPGQAGRADPLHALGRAGSRCSAC